MRSILVALGVTAIFGWPNPTVASVQIVGTANIVDGDTIDIGPVRIRLHGIDTAETGQTCPTSQGGDWRCGAYATRRLTDLIDGRSVSCDALDRDAYNRVIARCYSDTGEDLARALVAEGLAWAFTRYSDDYVSDEAHARADGRGVWRAEAIPPWEWRSNRWERAAEASPRVGCPIKGNINRRGERIYHTPWSPNYARTIVTEANGERWFCDEAEAQAAGWRAPRN
ncbi:thermonuclease family protein [Pararhodobacter oceanensis]|nr:thermonuclease family protein [Pararhodobacter oceanensis]